MKYVVGCFTRRGMLINTLSVSGGRWISDTYWPSRDASTDCQWHVPSTLPVGRSPAGILGKSGTTRR